MSQTITNPFALDPIASPFAPVPPTVATTDVESPGEATLDTQARQVMNDIFGEVERLLQDGSPFSFAPPAPEPALPTLGWGSSGSNLAIAPQSSTLSSAIALPTGTTIEHTPTDNPTEEEALAQLDAALMQPLPVPDSTRSSKLFDRILLGLACAALVGTAAVWVLLQMRLQQAANPTPAAASQVASADRDFAQYMGRSLQVIDQKAEARGQVANASNPNADPTRVAVAPTGAAPGSRVTERIYVPVYQPPSAFNLPNVPLSPGVPAPLASGQTGTATQPLPAPAITTVPLNPTAGQTAPNQTAAAAVPNIAPAQHTLVGVLELGDRSAALFEINGTAQRIQIGEPISSSGWTLVSIRNQEAIVRRNGEVRSIYVGQQF